jgi:hypothetical protein
MERKLRLYDSREGSWYPDSDRVGRNRPGFRRSHKNGVPQGIYLPAAPFFPPVAVIGIGVSRKEF